MKRLWGAAAAGAVLCAACAPDRSPPRAELAEVYARLDTAIEAQRWEEVLDFALPDAAVFHGNTRVRFADSVANMKRLLEGGGAVKQRTVLTSVDLNGADAKVARTTEVSVTLEGRTRSGVEHSDDTWTRTARGWRLKYSVAAGGGETAQPSAASPAVVQELNHRARALDDLSQIGEAIGDARVVALGEATHGTLEFSQSKARIVEYLLRKKGFSVLAVEGNWPDVLAIDDYVQTGNSEPRQALRLLNSWPLETPGMLALIETFRALNRDRPGSVTFTGFDMQSPAAARERVLNFVRRAVPREFAEVEKLYREIQHESAALQVAERFEKYPASSRSDWLIAKQAAAVAYQSAALDTRRNSGFRDEMIARNVRWLLDEMHPGRRIILWAHNGHITSHRGGAFKPMGAWLREWLGSSYYSIALSVAGGEVRAAGENGLAKFTMPARDGTGERTLARASLASFFLDMRSLPAGSALREWLGEPRQYYEVGARWNDTVPEANTAVFPMAASFDGLVFFREGHAAGAP